MELTAFDGKALDNARNELDPRDVFQDYLRDLTLDRRQVLRETAVLFLRDLCRATNRRPSIGCKQLPIDTCAL